MKSILITGAAGRLGSVIAKGLKDKYHIRGFDLVPTPEIVDSVTGSINDKGALQKAAQGVDAIIHLAALISSREEWQPILENNIIGTYNVYEAARINNVKRFIFTSSCQVMFGYEENAPVTWDMLPHPISYYGVSKVTGEALGYMYSENFGMEVVCIRIGHFPSSVKSIQGGPLKGRYLSNRDAVQLYDKALIQPGIKFEIIYGASKSSKCIFDMNHTKEVLGYEASDCEEEAVKPGE